MVLVLCFWVLAVFSIKRLRLEKHGLDARPLYIVYRSKRLNGMLLKMGSWNPLFWKTFGEIAVAFAFGQMLFLGWVLITNLLRFLVQPSSAFPVFLTIPGITIRAQSLPYFIVSVSLIILMHEISHGVLCAAEGVPVKNSALVLAVILFGGAIEPDEEELKKRQPDVRMRIYAVGSLSNLAAGLLVVLLVTSLGQSLLKPALSLLEWLSFLSINVAVGNMLPIYPLDGYGVLSNLLDRFRRNGKILMRITSLGFMALMLLNLAMSFSTFGLISL